MIAISLPDLLNQDTFIYENVLGGKNMNVIKINM